MGIRRNRKMLSGDKIEKKEKAKRKERERKRKKDEAKEVEERIVT